MDNYRITYGVYNFCKSSDCEPKMFYHHVPFTFEIYLNSVSRKLSRYLI